MSHLCDSTVAGPTARRDNVLASRCEYPPFRIPFLNVPYLFDFGEGNLAGILQDFSDPPNKGSKLSGKISEQENSRLIKNIFRAKVRSADVPPSQSFLHASSGESP